MSLNTDRRVVVTGIGSLTPTGFGVEAFWEGVLTGRSNLVQIPASRFETSDLRSRIAGIVPDFDLWTYLERTRRMDAFVRSLSRYTRNDEPVTPRALFFAMAAAELALGDANATGAPIDRADTGVIVGSAFADVAIVTSDMGIGDGRKVVLGTSYAQTGVASYLLGTLGPSFSVSSACTTGLSAMDVASELYLRRGRAHTMLCGASGTYVSRDIFSCYDRITVLSRRNQDPHAAMRPFDEDRDGFVLSEGAVVHVLEELDHARARGATPYAEVVAVTQCTRQVEAMMNVCEEGYYAVTRALFAEAYASGRLQPGEISEDALYVHAHATATRDNEPMFIRAVTRAFREVGLDPAKIPTSCVYAVTGHLQDGSSGVALSAALLAIKHGLIPHTFNLERPISDELLLVHGAPLRRPVRHALVIGAGFCGTYAAALLRQVD